jgi:hypothetical protein
MHSWSSRQAAPFVFRGAQVPAVQIEPGAQAPGTHASPSRANRPRAQRPPAQWAAGPHWAVKRQGAPTSTAATQVRRTQVPAHSGWSRAS